jgi:hypothetical protein
MNTYKRHRFPPDIISYAVWLYYRFNLGRVVTATADVPDHSSKIYLLNEVLPSRANQSVFGVSNLELFTPVV